MSQDDIVFEDVRYREPVRLCRPDRDRRWACLAYEVPGADDLPIFLDRATADAIERHALRDTSVELGGILLGKECVDEQTGTPFVWVTKSVEARHYENTQASFTYTHDSWEEITRERDRLHPDLDIVGWYHTHPDFGVFLSGHDLFIQRHFFGQPLQVAYVVDPIRQTRGFFRWRNASMEQTGGFFLTADRGERAALSRLVNDLENIPNADPIGGGGLSPRLEAELIAMLTRPSLTHSRGSSTEGAQTALLFSLLGATLGMIGLAAVLWLGSLNNHVQDQARVLEKLRETLNETAEQNRIALDAAVGDSGTLSNKDFLERYGKAIRDRDQFKADMSHQAVNISLLSGKVKQLTDDLAKTRSKYEEASGFEKDAKEAAELREEVIDLRVVRKRQEQKIADLEDLLGTTEGRKAVEQDARATKLWYAAVSGWSVSGVLILVLIVLIGYRNLPEDLTTTQTPEEPPPHSIV